MKNYNTIAVAAFASLEIGDVFAYEFLGGVVSGVVSGMAFWPKDLTEENRAYMAKEDLEVPEGDWTPIAGDRQMLLFGTFTNSSTRFAVPSVHHHMYVDQNTRVAVFPYAKEDNEREAERRAMIAREEAELAAISSTPAN